MSVSCLVLVEVPAEIDAHEANIAKWSANSVGNEHHEVAYENISCVFLRVLRIPHNWQAACVQEIASTENSEKLWIVTVEKNDCPFVRVPVTCVWLCHRTDWVFCVCQWLDTSVDYKKHEHDDKNDTIRANFHEYLDVFLTADRCKDNQDENGRVIGAEPLPGWILLIVTSDSSSPAHHT